MQVKQWGDGNVMVVVGSAQGGVSRMRFKVPLAPGSALAEIQASLPLCCSAFSQCSFGTGIVHSYTHTCACMQMVDMESDTQEGCLTVWQHCHTDDVAAVDINSDKQQVSRALSLHIFYLQTLLYQASHMSTALIIPCSRLPQHWQLEPVRTHTL